MKNILRRGAYLEFDNFGKEFTSGSAYGRFPSDDERMEVLYQLIDEGFTERILVSCDICLKNLLSMHEGPGYGHFLLKIADRILQRYPKKVLDLLVVENPARYLDNPRLD